MGAGGVWGLVIAWVDADLDRTCTSSMYTTTYNQLMKEFDCSQEVATLGLSFFIWGLGSLLCWTWYRGFY